MLNRRGNVFLITDALEHEAYRMVDGELQRTLEVLEHTALVRPVIIPHIAGDASRVVAAMVSGLRVTVVRCTNEHRS